MGGRRLHDCDAAGGWRLLRGPTLADRILALDTLYVNSVALLVLVGMYFGTAIYFEVALIIAMIGFVSTWPREIPVA